MTTEEKNRALAEWLGWHVYPNAYNAGVCQETLHGSIKPIPDFYLSESASALLLEKMVDRTSNNPWISDTEVSWSTNEKAWQCIVRRNWVAGQDTDRKTAIADAALKLALEGK